jgi:hypothetical protein
MPTNRLAAAADVSDWVANTDNYTKTYVVILSPTTFSGTLKLRTQAAVSGSDTVPTVADTTIQNPPNAELRVTLPPGYRFRFALTAVVTGAVVVAVHELKAGFSAAPQAFIRVSDDAVNHLAAQTAFTAVALVVTHLGSDVAGSTVAAAITDLGTINTALTAAFGVA